MGTSPHPWTLFPSKGIDPPKVREGPIPQEPQAHGARGQHWEHSSMWPDRGQTMAQLWLPVFAPWSLPGSLSSHRTPSKAPQLCRTAKPHNHTPNVGAPRAPVWPSRDSGQCLPSSGAGESHSLRFRVGTRSPGTSKPLPQPGHGHASPGAVHTFPQQHGARSAASSDAR